ncbi:putative reverse transcriptase domain-containing protein [Tanacetum coccineum]
MLAQVGNQGNVGNQNGNVVNENVQENVRNVIVNGNRVGCSYKEFLACNPKEYDGKGGVVVLTRWIEKMESVQDMSGCSVDQKVKYTAGSFVGKALTWWNSQIRTLSREVAVSMSWNDFKFMMIEEFCPSHEMQKLVPHLVTLERRKIERYVYGLTPQICGMVAVMEPKTMQKAPFYLRFHSNFFTTTFVQVTILNITPTMHPRGLIAHASNCNRPGHLAKDSRGVQRNVNPVNARNPTVRACYECGSTDHVRSACPRLNRHKDSGRKLSKPKLALITVSGSRNASEPDRGIGNHVGAEEARPGSEHYTAGDKKQEEIIVVRYFPKVFPDDLFGLPPIRFLWAMVMERFIENFSKIAKSLTILTQKCKTFNWGEEQELAFQTLKDKLCNVPVLALPIRTRRLCV